MFDSIAPVIVKPKFIDWKTPKFLDIDTGDNDIKTYEILKGAENFLHSELDVKASTMKDVYKKAPEIWKQLKDYRLKVAAENPNEKEAFTFDKSTVVYLSNSANELVDIVDLQTDERYNEFKQNLEKYILNVTTITKTRKFYSEGKNIVKLICYDKDIELPAVDYAPVIIIEYNINKSTYMVYTGILVYKTFTLIPTIGTYYETDKLSTLINNFNFDDALEYANEQADSLYNNYQHFVQNPVEISARELISLLKKVGYKLELKTDDDLASISAIEDEASNEKIQQFFNTFKFKTSETAYDILNLTELKKMFRYNELTLLDVLSVLSKEYLNYEGAKITVDVLSSIVFDLSSKHNDKKEVEAIKEEVVEEE